MSFIMTKHSSILSSALTNIFIAIKLSENSTGCYGKFIFGFIPPSNIFVKSMREKMISL